MYREIEHCRMSKSNNLINILNLGEHSISGIFPRDKNQKVDTAPLELLWCPDSGLLQLKHTYSLEQMYGLEYGYRSALNQSMVKHLMNKVKLLEKQVNVKSSDMIIDIGSNDGTTLKAYSNNAKKVGIDPTGIKFKKYYTDDVILIDDFFPTPKLNLLFPNKKAKIITSIAMFYDLEDPVSFVESIAEVLDKDGIWHFEQSYLPSMLRQNAYDTVCHEHLEYYSLHNIIKILSSCKLKVLDIQINDINGGSFAVTTTHSNSKTLKQNHAIINWMLEEEDKMGLHTEKPYREFEKRVLAHKNSLKDLVDKLIEDGKKIFGYGASTKGNVLLQYCGFSENEIQYIAEINEDKFGCFTPGTHIPIISESEAKKMKPDYFLVLPWHFRNNIIQRERDFLLNGGKFIFPLPFIEIV